LVAAILASASVFLSSSVVNVALPTIDRALRAGFSGLQWIVDGYLLTLASLLILGGALGDRLGRRRIMLIGLVGFAISLIFCGLAPSIEWLVAWRVVQGVAGALMVPESLALIRSVYPDPEERGGAIGNWSGWSGIATVVGPLIGGWMVTALSWRWVFFLNLPFLGVAAWLLLAFVPESKEQDQSARLDVGGAILVTLGLAGLAYGLIEGPVVGWNRASVIASLGVGSLALIAFPLVEARVSNPMVPLEMFRSSNFSGANLTTLGVYAALQGTSFMLVLYVQNIMGYSPLVSGMTLAPVSLLLLLLSPWMGRLAGRHGPRWFMTIGPLVTALGLALLTLLQPDSSVWLELLPMIVVFGVGMGITVAPLTNTVMSSVPDRQASIAAAFNNMVSRVAGLLAVAVLGILVASTFQEAVQAQLESVSLSSNMAERLRSIAQNPTAGSGLDQLSQSAQRIYEDAFTRSFRWAMGFSAALAALGGVLAFVTIGSNLEEDSKSPDNRKEEQNGTV
jgi:EmrB/QacA subfamily drug resistance transporter